MNIPPSQSCSVCGMPVSETMSTNLCSICARNIYNAKPEIYNFQRMLDASSPDPTPAEPVAWMFPRRYGSGLSFVRPANYEDAEGNVVRPTPLYTIGGQGHEAAARCSDRSIASSEATCLNAGPSARIGTDTQQGKLDADAGSIPAPPTHPPASPAEPMQDLLRRINAEGGSEMDSNDQSGEVAASTSQQEKQNDDESDSRRTRRLAGEGGQTGTEHGRVDQQREGGSGTAEHDAGILCPQRTGNLGEGNAGGVMPLLFDSDWLRNRIEADPDDNEPSAGPSTSPDPTPSDDLVALLRECSRSDNSLYMQAAARIVELERRISNASQVIFDGNQRESSLRANWYRECADADNILFASGLSEPQWRTDGGSLQVPRIVAHFKSVIDRAERAESEVAKLRRVVETAKMMRNGISAKNVSAFDAALAELEKP